MANGGDLQRNHTKFIVAVIGMLGFVSIICGTVLIFKGYHADLLVGAAIGAIGGLTGLLGQSKPNATQPDITMTGGQNGQPPQVTLTQQPKPATDAPLVITKQPEVALAETPTP